MSIELISILLLFISFFALLAYGVPVAYSIGVSTTITILLNIAAMPGITTVAQRMTTGIDSFALLAIPFFVLAGELMNRGGIANRLINFAKSMVGSLPGGLAYVNVLAAMLFGAISGSAVAAASAIGSVMTERMEDEGFPRKLAAFRPQQLGGKRLLRKSNGPRLESRHSTSFPCSPAKKLSYCWHAPHAYTLSE